VTYGCGTSRSGTRKFSFLLYDLHHLQGTDYRGLIAGELRQLQVTVDETRACVSRTQSAALRAHVALIRSAYNKNRLALAKLELIGLLRVVQTSRVDAQLAKCAFDLDTRSVVPVNPADPELIARNFRGDLIVQTRHVLYMLERMLGVTQPAVPNGL
jgi:hypothetical protein